MHPVESWNFKFLNVHKGINGTNEVGLPYIFHDTYMPSWIDNGVLSEQCVIP